MKKEQVGKLREKKLSEAREELKKALKELFNLKMEAKTGKLKNLRTIYHKRKEVAVIKTIIREKELEK